MKIKKLTDDAIRLINNSLRYINTNIKEQKDNQDIIQNEKLWNDANFVALCIGDGWWNMGPVTRKGIVTLLQEKADAHKYSYELIISDVEGRKYDVVINSIGLKEDRNWVWSHED